MSDRATEIRYEIHSQVAEWARVVADGVDSAVPPRSVDALSVWLLAPQQQAWLLASDVGPEIARALSRLVARAERVAAPGRAELVRIGTCPGRDGEGCGGRVLCEPVSGDAWCVICRDRGDVSWWRSRLPSADEWLPVTRLVAHVAIAHEVQLRENLVRLWAHRGQVRTRRVGRRAEYHVQDVLFRAGIRVVAC